VRRTEVLRYLLVAMKYVEWYMQLAFLPIMWYRRVLDLRLVLQHEYLDHSSELFLRLFRLRRWRGESIMARVSCG